MPNASITTNDVAIRSIEYFEEILGIIENEHVDFVPFKETIRFLSGKIDIDINLFLSKSSSFWIGSDVISFIEFWRLYEELFKYSCLVNYLQSYDGILDGMIYLRDRIIDESINHKKNTNLSDTYTVHNKLDPRRGIGITVCQIHSIILEIISKNICNNSSAYWQDVLSQIPQDKSSNMFLELVDISNSIFQWLKEYLISCNKTSICSSNSIVTRIISNKEGTNCISENDEINYNSEKVTNHEIKKKVENTGFDVHCNSFNYNYESDEIYINSFERLPWRGQTMFSNFRELQISLQSILERVILNSDKVKNSCFLKKDEVAIRKISHMMTELEDYLYSQLDILHKERNRSEQIEIENNNLKKQLKAAIEESEEYKFEMQSSISQKNKCEKEIEQFLSQKNRLSSDLIRYKEENKHLEKKYEGLLYDYNELKERHEILCEENLHLINEIKKCNVEHKVETYEKRKYICRAQKTDNIPRISLDPNIVGYEINNLTDSSKSSIKKKKSESNAMENLGCAEECNLHKTPAIIKAIPDFLESSIQTPISCRTYRKKIGYFPEKTIDKELRMLSVVPTITETSSFEDRVDRKCKERTLAPLKKDSHKMSDEIGCIFQ